MLSRLCLRVLLVALGLGLALASAAEAVVCNQTPQGNTLLFGCSPFSSTCTLSGASAPAGCELDFGTRKVIFTGTFDVGGSALVVRAGQIQVNGALKARSDSNGKGGTINLTAADSVTVPGTIDVSGNSAGLIRLRAGGTVDLQSGGIFRARGIELSSTGNSASGGSIDVGAGTAFSGRGTIDLGGGNQGSGGSLLVNAGTNVVMTQPIDATGGAGDGGDIDINAGDDADVQRTIDVSSPSGGGGGTISIRAGVDRLGGVKVGGTLSVSGSMVADGNNDADGGYDGGDITLRAFGPVNVSGTLHATGGFPDGGGGSVIVDSSDNAPLRVTPLDGNLTLSSVIDVHGPPVGSNGDVGTGGDVDIFVGVDGTITGSMDLSGSDGGGDLTVFGGRTVSFGATVNASGTVTAASGGTVAMIAGRASQGSLAVTRTLDVSATSGLQGQVSLAGCGLSLAQGLTVTAKTGSPNAAPKIDLISPSTMTIGANGVYDAEPAGRVALVHPPGVTPQIGANVTFAPQVVHLTNNPELFPGCPVCGDGILQPGEPCDPGTADGACCNADCTAMICPTPTPTPTQSPTPTGPTRSATPTRTRTPTPTVSATPTLTVEPTGPTGTATATPPPTETPPPTVTPPPPPSPTATPVLPFIEPKPVLACEKTLGKATSTLVLGTLKTLEACSLEAFKCMQSRPAGSERDACYATTARRCDAKLAKLQAVHAKFRDQFIDACGGDPPAVPTELLRSTDVLGFALLQPQCFGLDLSSPELVLGCLQIITPCEIERALGFGVPRVGDLLDAVGDTSDRGCLPNATGHAEGLAGSPIAPQTIRCQRAVATAGRKLLTRQLAVARGCVDALFKCRLTGKPRETCLKVAATCNHKIAGLDDPTTGARAKMLAAINAACGTLPASAVIDAAGIGFEAIDDRCIALGFDGVSDTASAAACVTRAYTCAGSDVVRQALPLVDRELERVGLTLGDDAFCAVPTATPTPTVTGTPTRTPTPARTPTPTLSTTPTPTFTNGTTPVVTSTPTVTSTPVAPTATPTTTATATPLPADTPTPTPLPTPGCPNGILEAGEQCDFGDDVPGDGCDPTCQFEQLVPGGGSNDCIAEWAVINPFNTPPLGIDDLPNTTQTCVDGDPSCDFDSDPDQCTFRVALCLQNVDPNLPECVAPPGIAKFLLTSPRPNSSDPQDAANATLLMASFGRLSDVPATGDSGNTLVFDPPVVVEAPDNCTDIVELVVERRGLSERSEKFRITTTSVPTATSRGVEDDDTLLLTCVAEPQPTPTATP